MRTRYSARWYTGQAWMAERGDPRPPVPGAGRRWYTYLPILYLVAARTPSTSRAVPWVARSQSQRRQRSHGLLARRPPAVRAAIQRGGRRCEQGCLRWYGPVMHAPDEGVGGGVAARATGPIHAGRARESSTLAYARTARIPKHRHPGPTARRCSEAESCSVQSELAEHCRLFCVIASLPCPLRRAHAHCGIARSEI